MRPAPARSKTLAMIRAVSVVACALGAACSGAPPPLKGSPVLTQVYWSSGGTQVLVWSLANDPALVSPVPPFASEVDFVFDRRLDGSLIEDMVTHAPKDPPSVRASWPDMATTMSEPPYGMAVHYASSPRYGGVSAYVYVQPDVPGFPAGDTVSFTLVPTRLTGATGEAATLPADPIVVKTQSFSVNIGASKTPVQASYQLPLSFSNRLPAAPLSSPLIHVRAGGAEVPYRLLPDAGLVSRWYLAAGDCFGGAWPPLTTFEVTIAAGFADAFGRKLAEDATATFSTGPGAATPSAAACLAADAGAADAARDAADAGAPESGAEDAASDAAVDGAAAVDGDAAIDDG
jgi:hypothetical protein